jgi:DNA-binding response OmpR family regulator
MHILLVEPDRVLGGIYKAGLERATFSVAHALSAQSAIALADDQTPHVILLELQLPTHNGIAFLHELRSYAEWQQIPVVIHSYVAPHQYTIEERAALEQNLGIVAWLYKPRTTLEQLVSIARDYAKTQLGSDT